MSRDVTPGSLHDEGFAVSPYRYRDWPHPLHLVLLAGVIPLFLGALLSDIAYSRTYHIQWSNFASWLLAGGLVFCGFALLFALVELVRADHKRGQPLIYFLVLLATWLLGFLNALDHAKDAWAIMPTSLILSVIITVLICVATALRLARRAAGGDA